MFTFSTEVAWTQVIIFFFFLNKDYFEVNWPQKEGKKEFA